jgi:hypothetical protein
MAARRAVHSLADGRLLRMEHPALKPSARTDGQTVGAEPGLGLGWTHSLSTHSVHMQLTSLNPHNALGERGS